MWWLSPESSWKRLSNSDLKETPEEPSPQVEWKLGVGGVRVTKNIPLSVVEYGLLVSVMDHLPDSEAGALPPWPEV